LEDVKVWDILPSEFSYLDGTCFVNGKEVGDGITGAGLMLGDLYADQTKYMGLYHINLR